MIEFILGLFIGGSTGVVIMGLFKANKHQEILEDSEDEK